MKEGTYYNQILLLASIRKEDLSKEFGIKMFITVFKNSGIKLNWLV
jgi:hypothetical protein